MKKGEKSIEAYMDAWRTVRGLEQANQDEGRTPERDRALKEAKAMLSERTRPMTGGMLGEAKRRLFVQDSVSV